MNRLFCLFVCVIICFIVCETAYSQASVNFGINISAGLKGFDPNGKRGLGGSIEYIHKLWKHGGIRASVGYEWFDYRRPKSLAYQSWIDSLMRYPTKFQDITFVPVRLGFQQFMFGEQACLYAEAGIAHVNPSRLTPKNVFSFSVGTGGYRLPIKKNQYLQLLLSYNYNSSYKYNHVKVLSNHSYLSFTIAYGLRFGVE